MADQNRVNGRFSKKTKKKIINSLSNLKSFDNQKKLFTLQNFPPCMNIGRRVVEWKEIVEGLKSCDGCGERLNILDCISETVQGLGSILKVKCVNCADVNTIYTGKRHASATGGVKKIFDANSKIATGMLCVLLWLDRSIFIVVSLDKFDTFLNCE